MFEFTLFQISACHFLILISSFDLFYFTIQFKLTLVNVQFANFLSYFVCIKAVHLQFKNFYTIITYIYQLILCLYFTISNHLFYFHEILFIIVITEFQSLFIRTIANNFKVAFNYSYGIHLSEIIIFVLDYSVKYFLHKEYRFLLLCLFNLCYYCFGPTLLATSFIFVFIKYFICQINLVFL